MAYFSTDKSENIPALHHEQFSFLKNLVMSLFVAAALSTPASRSVKNSVLVLSLHFQKQAA